MAPTTTAAAVSAKLRRAGFRPVAPSDHNREGLKVRNDLAGVTVTADLDSARAAAEMAADAAQVLAEAGYTVTKATDTRLVVTKAQV